MNMINGPLDANRAGVPPDSFIDAETFLHSMHKWVLIGIDLCHWLPIEGTLMQYKVAQSFAANSYISSVNFESL